MDYIFYRAYMAYEKKKDPGHFGATMYCTVISMFLLMPAFGLLDIFLDLEKSQRKTGVVIYILFVAVGVIYRYYGENRLKKIIQKYRGANYNRIIPTWLIFLILPISMVIGVWLFALTSKL